MNGIDEHELESTLTRVFARHRIPLELRLVIWKLVLADLERCEVCKKLFSGIIESYNHCGNPNCRVCGYVDGYSFTPTKMCVLCRILRLNLENGEGNIEILP
jgi:hypothetical protein